MEEIKKQGKTVLIVSHNIRQIQRLCNRAILLDHGKIIIDQDSQKVLRTLFGASVMNEYLLIPKLNNRISKPLKK